ncbi:MAG: FixH family protein [Nitrospiraceae bacterium]|nr:MAG: FixH family protein [Nitrospiraceae bacterium]
MKRAFIGSIISMFLVCGAVYANQFSADEKAGDLKVKVEIQNNPLIVGDNIIEIQLVDSSGALITDADVTVYYFMPSMPAMNYEVKASTDGGRYAAVIKPVMPGTWDADIKVIRNGGTVQKATISFDAK